MSINFFLMLLGSMLILRNGHVTVSNLGVMSPIITIMKKLILLSPSEIRQELCEILIRV